MLAPVVVLGAGAAGAAMLARLLGDLLDGSWLSLRVVGETAAWGATVLVALGAQRPAECPEDGLCRD